jgi:hypothetical protein
MIIRDEVYEKLKRNKYLRLEDVEEVIERDEDSVRIDAKLKARNYFDRVIKSYSNVERQYIRENIGGKKKKTPIMVLSEGDGIEVYDSWCKYTQTEVFHPVCENECNFYGRCDATEMFKKMNLYKDKIA